MKGKRKAVISAILPLVLMCSFVTSGFGMLQGDFNGDSKTDIIDVHYALSCVTTKKEYSDTQLAACDYNGNGKIDLYDVEMIYEDSAKQTFDVVLKKKGFPDSYIPYLMTLHNKYPNWNFEPFNTGLDWQAAVNGERSTHRQQLIEGVVGSAWKCSCSTCKGKIFEYPNWYAASEGAVKYYMDPRNFLTEDGIFQFESTLYDQTQTLDGVEVILKGTWMYNANITYLDTDGKAKTFTLDGKTMKYSEAIIKAAVDSGMSAYYLAAKIRQEVGGSSATAGGASGKSAPYYGIYNYYNIGAFTGATDGLEWANGYMTARNEAPLYSGISATNLLAKIPAGTELYYKGMSGNYYYVKVSSTGAVGFVPKANVTLKTDYERPWTNPYKSIYYGAMWIYDSFEGQFTNYLQKFNVNAATGKLHWNEYMANVRAADSEAYSTYNAYSAMGLLSAGKTFSIPIFKNMPLTASPDPTQSGGGTGGGTPTVTTKKGVAYNLEGDPLNIRSGAGTSYEIVTQITEGQEVAILATSAAWYKVQFSKNGTSYTGYASSAYIKIIS